MLSYRYRNYIKKSKKKLLFTSLFFLIFYYNFEKNGGFYDSKKDSAIWIILPSIQGFFYAFVIRHLKNLNQKRAGPIKGPKIPFWEGEIKFFCMDLI